MKSLLFIKESFFRLVILGPLIPMLVNGNGFDFSKKESFNTEFDKDNLFNADKGVFTDDRDGKKYAWVRIGTQIWMAENLRYKSATGCMAYKNKWKRAEKEGYLYAWKTAQLVSPKGWHLPSKDEYEIMISFVCGSSSNRVAYDSLKKDRYSLNFKVNGIYLYKDKSYVKGLPSFQETQLWTSSFGLSYNKDTLCKYFFCNNRTKEAGIFLGQDKNDALPVRCVLSQSE